VFQEKSDNEPPLTPRLHTAKAQVIAIARGLGALQAAHGLPTNAEDYCKQILNFGVVDVVYDWARGVPFNEVMVDTNELVYVAQRCKCVCVFFCTTVIVKSCTAARSGHDERDKHDRIARGL
jgi:DSHCT (NUC185) domain